MAASIVQRQELEIAIPEGCDTTLTGQLLEVTTGERLAVSYGPSGELHSCAPDARYVLPNGHVEVRFERDEQPVVLQPQKICSLFLSDPSPGAIDGIRAAAKDALARAANLSSFAEDLLSTIDRSAFLCERSS
jgi:hypothetical protein